MSGMARALDSHAHAPCPNPSLTSCRIYLHWPVFNYTTLCESKQNHVYLASVDLCYGYQRELSICQNWPADFGHPTNEKPRFCLIYIATYDKTAHLGVTFARSRSQFGRIDTLYYSMALSKDKRSQYILTVNLGSTISFFFFYLKTFFTVRSSPGWRSCCYCVGSDGVFIWFRWSRPDPLQQWGNFGNSKVVL